MLPPATNEQLAEKDVANAYLYEALQQILTALSMTTPNNPVTIPAGATPFFAHAFGSSSSAAFGSVPDGKTLYIVSIKGNISLPGGGASGQVGLFNGGAYIMEIAAFDAGSTGDIPIDLDFKSLPYQYKNSSGGSQNIQIASGLSGGVYSLDICGYVL